jgi:hypothetical protein
MKAAADPATVATALWAVPPFEQRASLFDRPQAGGYTKSHVSVVATALRRRAPSEQQRPSASTQRGGYNIC